MHSTRRCLSGHRRRHPAREIRRRRSGGAPFVAMMEAADLGDRHDAAIDGRGDRARDRRVFVQRQMRSGLFVIRTHRVVISRSSPVALNTMT